MDPSTHGPGAGITAVVEAGTSAAEQVWRAGRPVRTVAGASPTLAGGATTGGGRPLWAVWNVRAGLSMRALTHPHCGRRSPPVGAENRAGPFDDASLPSGGIFGIVTELLAPRSRGSLRLRSADPADPPWIDPAHLRHPDDLARMVEATLVARRISRTPPLADLVPGREIDPGDEIGDDDTNGLARSIRPGQPVPPPRRYLRDGPGPGHRCGGERTVRRSRHRGVVRRGRIDHADDPGGEHQPADDRRGRTDCELARRALISVDGEQAAQDLPVASILEYSALDRFPDRAE